MPKKPARLLDITLTTRGQSAGTPIKMAGVPLSFAGAVSGPAWSSSANRCDLRQICDPATSMGPVERAVARIVTPGTLTDAALLDDKRDVLLLAVASSPPALRTGLA